MVDRKTARQRYLARKKKERQRKIWSTVILLALVLLIVFLITKCSEPTIEQPTIPVITTTAPETEPPLEITWKTLPADYKITAKQYFAYDSASQTYLSSFGEGKVYPASVTKLFSAYVALQYLEPDHIVVVDDISSLVVRGSSVAEITIGEKYTAGQLVEAMLLPSGNDAAYALAVAAGRMIADNQSISVSRASQVFVERMNEMAQEVGMNNTHFANPDGIHKNNHYTTFDDLVIMAERSLEDPTISHYAAVSSGSKVSKDGEEIQWENTNELIRPDSEFHCPYAVGLKTGQTPSAGSCLLSAFRYKDSTWIVGVFGSADKNARFDDTLFLFNQIIEDVAVTTIK